MQLELYIMFRKLLMLLRLIGWLRRLCTRGLVYPDIQDIKSIWSYWHKSVLPDAINWKPTEKHPCHRSINLTFYFSLLLRLNEGRVFDTRIRKFHLVVHFGGIASRFWNLAHSLHHVHHEAGHWGYPKILEAAYLGLGLWATIRWSSHTCGP